ncbi:glycosyltransferase family 2 protein [Williamwhitmania taraxaci]|uniref:Glycosyltransferase, GT2 family n=1 Tax=Williamwhitmania taraxaci TaxID=1640674 RepID=A0A1G6GSB1_9BACT|nr:glycosyltransferase family 2 protein [Williamwhitmania taraxaci]SDB84801.1 Glycosyltransferase, GT2 family [Williamwhitmania taraxaci]
MKLSIIIVSYNVKHFLDQCLQTVQAATAGLDAEVFVVDNLSGDGSCEMVREKHPWVNLIENKQNTGFAVANNQAIQLSKGEYILLLNPDTLVQEQTFSKCIDFMDSHPDAGAMGVKMIDGKGNYLPESKRGLPTPAVAFYKISGIIKLRPRSARFAKYYMGHLPADKTNEVEILAGAFMFMRMKTLNIAGLLDEDFFMYGEDIDLSYRILKAGYKNYYFAETSIIHYKGESTKKGSINYVMVFYKAMILFAQKHFSSGDAQLYTSAIRFAIYLRALISLIKRGLTKIILPLLDSLTASIGYLTITHVWGSNMKGVPFPTNLTNPFLAGIIIIFLLSIFLSGGYDRPLRLNKVWKGVVIAAITILLFYNFLPEKFRFSRAIIASSATIILLLIPTMRIVAGKILGKGFIPLKPKKIKKIIVADTNETDRINKLLELSGAQGEVSQFNPTQINYNFDQQLLILKEKIRVQKIDEVIFSANDLSTTDIITLMLQLSSLNCDFKIAPTKGLSLIGSNSIETAGDLYTIGQETLASTTNRRLKRIIDFSFGLFFLSTIPLWLPVNKKPKTFLFRILKLLIGKETVVGYLHNDPQLKLLPNLKHGIISPSNALSINTENAHTTNLMYAKNYTAAGDILIILKSFPNLIKGNF